MDSVMRGKRKTKVRRKKIRFYGYSTYTRTYCIADILPVDFDQDNQQFPHDTATSQLVCLGGIKGVICQRAPAMALGRPLERTTSGHRENHEAADEQEHQGCKNEARAQQPGQQVQEDEQVEEDLLVGQDPARGGNKWPRIQVRCVVELFENIFFTQT